MFEERLVKAQAALESAPFSVFVSAAPSTVHYLAGFRSMAAQIYEDSEVVAVLTPGTLTLVLPKGQVAAAVDAGVEAHRIVAFGEFYYFGDDYRGVRSVPEHPDLDTALAEVLRSVKASEAVVGLEATRLSPSLRSAVRASGPKDVRDATSWIRGVRSTKLPHEIEMLRRSAEVSELGIRRALEAAHEGVTEHEIAGVIAATMVSEGAEPKFLSVQTGHRGGLGDAYPSHKPWRRGELLRIDVGCTVDGYWSDIARTAILGQPDPDQVRAFEALRLGQLHELEALKPGLLARELFSQTRDVIRGNGLPDFERNHCGHGIGLSVYDAPQIRATDETVLVPGMVLCLEVPYYMLGAGGILTEDTVLVTEDGCSSFTTLSRDLTVID